MENEKKSGGDKYSKLAGNTLIFAISSFSSKLLTLMVWPFNTSNSVCCCDGVSIWYCNFCR